MAINIATLSPASIKAKEVATEEYVDTKVANIDVSGDINNNNDIFAQKLGYSNYQAMVNAATSGQTIINGGYINTELVQANAITANMINTSGLVAENISATEIYGKKIVGAIIEGAIIKASYLDLNQGLKLLTNYVIAYSTYISNMNAYPDCIYESDTNTYRIPTLTRVAENTKSQSLAPGQVMYGALSAYNVANQGNLLKARLPRPTFETTGSFRVISSSSRSSNSLMDFSIKIGGVEILRVTCPISFRDRTSYFYITSQYGNSETISVTCPYSYPRNFEKYTYGSSSAIVVNTPVFKFSIVARAAVEWLFQSNAGGGAVFYKNTTTSITLDSLAWKSKLPFDWTSGQISIHNNNSGSLTGAFNSHLFIDNTLA